MRPPVTGRTAVAGVVGAPVDHSLSPTLHNAWIAAAQIDAVYVAFRPAPAGFEAFVAGQRGGAIRGLNVTAPFKGAALALADRASPRATAAGAANLLLFAPDGAVVADNTDGEGLLAAFAEQAPGFKASGACVVVLGAGGAARGAASALVEAGAAEVRVVGRSAERAAALAALFGRRVVTVPWSGAAAALGEARAVINATPLGYEGAPGPDIDLSRAPAGAVVMDMVYRPVRTRWLARAEARGLATVDGLAMLIGQAAPSFRALFGVDAPAIDVRAVAMAALEAQG